MTNPNGRFGIHGGQYIPETLMNAVIELEKAYNYYKNDPAFNAELTELFNEYAGRPSRLYYARRMTDLGLLTSVYPWSSRYSRAVFQASSVQISKRWITPSRMVELEKSL